MIRPVESPQETLAGIVDFLLEQQMLEEIYVQARPLGIERVISEAHAPQTQQSPHAQRTQQAARAPQSQQAANAQRVTHKQELLADSEFAQIDVHGLAIGSKDIICGDVFLAVPGERVHGAKFATDAQAVGAVAVITDRAGWELINSHGTVTIPVLVVANIVDIQGLLAAHVFGNPSSATVSYGITGTNGKTTTSYILDSLLSALGHTVGLVGTVVVKVGDQEIPASMTTPQAVELQSMLANMRERGMDSLVMEVSSHALAQKRTKPICFDVAGFTNLTQDHLDFHKTFEDYYAAKKELFEPQNSRFCVISTDDEFGRRLYEETQSQRAESCVALAVKSDLDGRIGWHVEDISLNADGSYFDLYSPQGEKISVHLGMPGEFNVYNAALAIAMLVHSGISCAQISQVLYEQGGLFPRVPGRMELISSQPRVIVDFAHNPDALAKAISTLRPTTAGKLVVLTGSAGDRDRAKRPLMGEIVSALADFTVITDDDPHSEDPAQIREEIIAGIKPGADFEEIADRSQAIASVIARAQSADTIFIAGRGHELWQDCDGVMIELDDRVVARQALEAREKNSVKER
ncbi:UDP-N-acetylmuramoyl-L-alanyl-D-glutamate--2,6-diaminopimelate ligase [Arcanobacterium pluranimalium]|uniref:UDP-N-acetylmuramoyl-L-alanyl-D-glutamate--2, 6-diaminopimelate ligase n=1 Tax=Arcanobacterium pluranimalium TaxID=108028 RepID=UPI001EF975FA|nr:UDP-N-acetylmuramoyl-L-alanyl-D-glutamate--2,6-diaminopimelate ligase [Arcanobacterium pluranimalium]